VVVDNGNPVAMLPESHTVATALASREFVVVLEQFLTDTAGLARVVLPVTTMLEETDLLGAFGHHYLTASSPVTSPPPGPRSDLEIYQGLASRLGFEAAMAGTPAEWAARLLAPVAGQVHLDELQAGAVRNPRVPPVLFAGRRFATADGSFHFVTDVDLSLEPEDRDYPLELGSFSTPDAQSSQWSIALGDAPLRARCHPAVAAGIADGAPARVVSRLGTRTVTLHHDPALRRDQLLLPKGGWLRHGRAANALVRARATDLGLGAAYYDEHVRLEPL
jgi:predicted molibdopterin-dependent oxidoreductase YjgC